MLDAARTGDRAGPPAGGHRRQPGAGPGPDPVQLAYLLASMLGLDVIKEQALLEAESPEVALQLILDHLNHEMRVLELRNQIASKAQAEMQQGAARLLAPPAAARHPGRAGRDDAGEGRSRRAAPPARRRSICPTHVRKEAERELSRLERLPAAAPDFQVTRTYLELSSNCRGRSRPTARSTCRPPRRCSTPTTSAWRRSRSASSSTWRCSS